MAIKPILYSTDMVRAKMEGRKTQTRRTAGLQEVNQNPDNYDFSGFGCGMAVFKDEKGGFTYCKPRFNTLDILWTRESFFPAYCYDYPVFDGKEYCYKADNDFIGDHSWKPSIHMPKKAARLFDRVTNVRVERLQDISEEDCLAEGVYVDPHVLTTSDSGKGYTVDGFPHYDTAKEVYMYLWESINGICSWEENPWVWVYEFEPVERPTNFLT